MVDASAGSESNTVVVVEKKAAAIRVTVKRVDGGVEVHEYSTRADDGSFTLDFGPLSHGDEITIETV
jgi:hypothetical protein